MYPRISNYCPQLKAFFRILFCGQIEIRGINLEASDKRVHNRLNISLCIYSENWCCVGRTLFNRKKTLLYLPKNCSYLQMSSLNPQKSPVYLQMSPVYPPKFPVYSQKCVYVYVCVCVYIHVQPSIATCAVAYRHRHTHQHQHTHMHTYTYTHTHTHTHR